MTWLPVAALVVASSASALPARVIPASHHDVSPPLWLIPPAARKFHVDREPRRFRQTAMGPLVDPVVQSSVGLAAPPTATTFEAMGAGLSGFTVDATPPDTDGAVGLNHYVSLVNSGYAVFNKSGTKIFGPVATNTIFTGFSNAECATDDDGDGIVLYDRAADRWFLTQFAVSQSFGSTFYQCVAVSTSGDPTGSWARYAFPYTNFNDYGKFGVWPDGYYATYNMFNGTRFAGGEVCAFDRARMLTADPTAAQQCVNLGTAFGGLLPTDLDGSTAPPAGEPNFILGFNQGSACGSSTSCLQLWKFHVDWANTTNTKVTGPTNIPVANFSQPCGNTGGTCVLEPPVSGTSPEVDTLGDRMMFRVAYRNFGDHESLVANHTVTAGSSTGVRWYELRNPNGTPTVFQQGTFAPDSNFRWMASAAMDKSGNIAMGYSLSSATVKPSVYIAGRLSTDALNTMGQGESAMFIGTGEESGTDSKGNPITRWGDYSSMTVDPSDDCTFWYVGEYYTSIAVFAWHTRVGHFKFATCGGADFSISVTPPASIFIPPGGSADYIVNTAPISGFSTPIDLTVSGLPAGVTATFRPSQVSPGQASTMTLAVDAAAANTPPTTITVTGTAVGGTPQHSAITAVAIGTPPTNTFSLALDRGGGVIVPGGTTTFTVTSAVVSGDASETIVLAVDSLPAGISGSFSPTTIHAGGSSTLSLSASSSATVGDISTFNVTGTATSDTETASADLSVVGDFALSLTPASATVTQGSAPAFQVGATGAGAVIALGISGSLPAGVTARFSPSRIDPGTPSTLTLTIASNAPTVSNAAFTVRGVDSDGIARTTTGHLTIQLAPNDFSISLSPSSATVGAGQSTTVSISTVATGGIPEPISLTISGLPAGVNGSFSPAAVTAGGSSTLTLTAALTASAVSSAPYTVTGTAASATHSTNGSVTVAAPSLPLVAVVAPVNGTTVSGMVEIDADASPGRGATLTTIELRVDDMLLSTSTNSPASSLWDTTKFPNGTHNITARATDSNGSTTTSAAVTVTVNNASTPGGGSGGGGCSTGAGATFALLGLLVLCRRRWK